MGSARSRRGRRIGAVWPLIALLVLAARNARAGTEPDSVVAAVHSNDVAALETLAKSATTAQQRALAAGVLLAWRHDDVGAIAVLVPVARSTASRVVRAAADLALSDVYSRDQRYRACYSAIQSALQLSPQSVNGDYRQAAAFARALFGVSPMQLVRETPGSLPITDAAEGVIRVPVKINGKWRGAMVDTGASYSTISASVAKRSGIRMLSHAATVGSSTERAVGVRLGIAKRLRFGNAMLENVVFIVMPDSAWGIPPSFGVNAIIGMPVLLALGRLEFANSGPATLSYGVPRGELTAQAGIHSNILLAGLEPLVIVRVPGAAKPLRMVLDTGANHTHFTRNVIADSPMLSVHAEPYVWHFGGMGGVVTQRRALRLPQVRLTIGETPIVLKNVVVSSDTSAASDGVIGEDIFRQNVRWIMDFTTMTLAVGKQGRTS